MKYELLEEGQRTKEGDEVFKDGEWLKLKDGAIGFVTFKGYVYRRALPDKPKVRLEDLTNIIEKKRAEWIKEIPSPDLNAEIAKSICTHLGLELEEEKQGIKKLPLTAKDFIKDGPWWVRQNQSNDLRMVLCAYGIDGVMTKSYSITFDELMKSYERTRDGETFEPCWQACEKARGYKKRMEDEK